MTGTAAAGFPAPGDAVRVVNLTPHPVTIYAGDAVIASWPPSGAFARLVEVSSERPPLITDAGVVPVLGLAYAAEVADLPEPAPGTVYLVSRVLAAAVARDDLFAPVGEVRDQVGRILGCRNLGSFAAADGADA
jgi:hypothetical protein